MDIKTVHKFKNEIEENGVIICYAGPVSQGILEEIGESVRKKIELQDTNTSKGEKVFSVFVEQVQNIMRYGKKTKNNSHEEFRSGISIIGEENGKFYCIAGNPISNGEVENIHSKLQKIQSMDKSELKAFFKQQIRKEPDFNSQGAGLGLIEMARQAVDPIEYHIEKLDENSSFFSIKVVL